jgi:thiamine transport system substrate-binding protein
MKVSFTIITVLLLVSISLAASLTIYAYDSFVSYGLSAKVIPTFEKMYNCKVNVVTSGDAADVLSKLIFEKKHPKADVILGIDQSLLSRAKSADILIPYKSPNLSKITNKDLIFDSQHYVTPYDFRGNRNNLRLN